MAPISGPILVASHLPRIRMTSIDARSNVTFHMGNSYVSFRHDISAKQMGPEFCHVFSSFFPVFRPFFYSKKSLKLIPLLQDLSIQWGSIPEEWPSWGDAENTVSIGHNMLKIALNTKFHEPLQCVLSILSICLEVVYI